MAQVKLHGVWEIRNINKGLMEFWNPKTKTAITFNKDGTNTAQYRQKGRKGEPQYPEEKKS